MTSLTFFRVFSIVLLTALCLPGSGRAEQAATSEMDLVADNWLSMITHEKGDWARSMSPEITNIQDIIVHDVLLGRCYSVSPQGYIVVPVLKALAPVKASSEDYDLNPNDADGFAALLRELFVDANKAYIDYYGDLSAPLPKDGDVPFGREYRDLWDRYTLPQAEFDATLTHKNRDTLVEVGPLLTAHWHQGAPYKNFCPLGDGGRCVVGCVATAAAQIMRYHQWPPYGDNEPLYYWTGDESCGGGTTGQWLSANVQDNYDWENMLDHVGTSYPQVQQDAVAELCYEVGVAYRMHYGRCGSGAYVTYGSYALPTYFRYQDSIVTTSRIGLAKEEWFALARQDIDDSLPISYRITRHAIVLDGYRVVDGVDQMHFNYGWNSSHNTWYTVDYLYCGWEGCTNADQMMLTRIMPDKELFFHIDTTLGFAPLSVEVQGSSEMEVDSWAFCFGEGDSAFTRTASHVYDESGNYDVGVRITSGDSVRTFERPNLVYVIADSVIAPTVTLPPDSSTEVVIYARNSIPLDEIRLPIDYTSGELIANLDSFSVAGCRTENIVALEEIHTWPTNQMTLHFQCSEDDYSNPLEPGAGPLLKLYFSPVAGSEIGQTLSISLDGYSTYQPQYYSRLLDFVPEMIPGELECQGCCKDFRGNINNDPTDMIDITDLIHLVNYMFSDGDDPGCWNEANIDGKGSIDVADLVVLVTYMFQEGPTPASCPQ